MYVGMYVCMNVCMYVCIDVCMYVRLEREEDENDADDDDDDDDDDGCSIVQVDPFAAYLNRERRPRSNIQQQTNLRAALHDDDDHDGHDELEPHILPPPPDAAAA